MLAPGLKSFFLGRSHRSSSSSYRMYETEVSLPVAKTTLFNHFSKQFSLLRHLQASSRISLLFVVKCFADYCGLII